jgi:hypothetical protein
LRPQILVAAHKASDDVSKSAGRVLVYQNTLRNFLQAIRYRVEYHCDEIKMSEQRFAGTGAPVKGRAISMFLNWHSPPPIATRRAETKGEIECL